MIDNLANLSNPQLEYQRQLVRDYIAKLNGNESSSSGTILTNTPSENYDINELKGFMSDVNKLTQKVSGFTTIQEFEVGLVELNTIFGKYHKIPQNFKEFIYVSYLTKMQEKNFTNATQILTSRQLFNLLIIANKFNTLENSKISFTSLYIDNIINFREKATTSLENTIATEISKIYLIGKNNTILKTENLDFTQSKLPDGISIVIEQNNIRLIFDTTKKYEDNSIIRIIAKDKISNIPYNQDYVLRVHTNNKILSEIKDTPIPELLAPLFFSSIQ